IAGAVMTVWAAYVLMFGGWIIISFKVLAMPVLLIIRGVRAAMKRDKDSTQPQFQGAVPGQPVFPAQGGYQQPQAGYPAQPQGGYPLRPQGGSPAEGAYPAPQSAPRAYGPPQQGGYPAPQPAPPAYGPPQQGGYPAPQPGYPAPQQGGYPAPQQGY